MTRVTSIPFQQMHPFTLTGSTGITRHFTNFTAAVRHAVGCEDLGWKGSTLLDKRSGKTTSYEVMVDTYEAWEYGWDVVKALKKRKRKEKANARKTA